MSKPRLPRELQNELDREPLPWVVTNEGRYIKISLNSNPVAIWPRQFKTENYSRALTQTIGKVVNARRALHD